MSLVIQSIQITPYKIKFTRPFFVCDQPLHFREGYYVTLTAGGFSAQGEAAPLEGFSKETLKKSHHDLKLYGEQLIGQALSLEKNELFSFLRNALKGSAASSCFALESAVLSLSSQCAGKSVVDFLNSSAKQHKKVALLQGDHAQVIKEAEAYRQQGYLIFKLKVGNRNVPLDVAKVRDVRSAIGSKGMLRLDANRAWQLSEAVLFIQLIGCSQIQFIEEPLSDPSQLSLFFQQTSCPVALDETLLTSRCEVTAPGRCLPTLSKSDAVEFYIIKPSLLGGVIVSLDWIAQAQDLDKKAIISSMFETSVGQSMLNDLASLTQQAPGFGTESWLLS